MRAVVAGPQQPQGRERRVRRHDLYFLEWMIFWKVAALPQHQLLQALHKIIARALIKPAAQRISNQMYIRNEALRNKWINKGRLVPVEEMEGFGISDLDYSTAHLTPLGKKRLYELGKRFRAGIQNPDEKMSYFMVSSITRSQQQQTQICERYPNACTKDHSPHSYGVAFDIYRLHSRNKNCNVGMKALEKVLQEMQKEGKILLCAESKCIHVTVCG